MKRIIVLGMHRSGTSALARAIGLLGAATGDPAHLAKTWENTPLRRVNDAVLESGGGAWDAPPAGDEWLDAGPVRALADRAERTLTAEFGTEPVTVWKDPRNSLTLPFWIDLFDEEPVVVLVHRHPAEVAASLRASGSLRPAHAYALWERYNAAALTAASGLPTIVLDYGQVMSFPAEAAMFTSRALAACGIQLPHDPAATDVELSPQRRHHSARTRDRIDAPTATESQLAIFDLLDTVAGAHRPLALPAPIPPASPLSEEILAMAGAMRQLEREKREARHGERKAKRSVKRASRSATPVPAADRV